MKLKLKLPLAFGATLLLLLLAALFGIASLHHSLETHQTSVAGRHEDERQVTDMAVRFKTQVQEWKNTLLRGKDPKSLDKYWTAFQKSDAEVAAQAQRLMARVPDGQARDLLKQFASAHAALGQAYRQGFEAFRAAGFDPAVGDQAVAGADRAPTRLLDEAARHIETSARAIAAQAAAEGRRATVLSLVVMATVFVAGIAGALWFSRRITRPLGQAVVMAQAVAAGDLGIRMVVSGDDETAHLLHALDRMRSALSTLVGGVRQNAENVATASSEIAQGNLDLSQRTEEQASALQQTAASMEQLSTTVRLSADNAQQASTMALAASAVGVKGGEVVGAVVNTMKDINASSRRIADIVVVIDGIAFQTNILALNAAVEAARAGEQGRGFAVVAGEVRSLAQRSASAAREIKSLIAESVARVDAGSALVDRAGATMADVVASIQRVSDIVGEISNASQEQSAGVAQIGQAVSQMDQVTQQNAALVEEGAAAAESLKQQAAQLVGAVAAFRIAG